MEKRTFNTAHVRGQVKAIRVALDGANYVTIDAPEIIQDLPGARCEVVMNGRKGSATIYLAERVGRDRWDTYFDQNLFL